MKCHFHPFDAYELTLSLQTIDRDSALPRYCRPCVRWHPAAATLSPSQNAAVMGGEAGVTSVSFARFLELPSTKRSALMAQDTPLMEEVRSWGIPCILSVQWTLIHACNLQMILALSKCCLFECAEKLILFANQRVAWFSGFLFFFPWGPASFKKFISKGFDFEDNSSLWPIVTLCFHFFLYGSIIY